MMDFVLCISIFMLVVIKTFGPDIFDVCNQPLTITYIWHGWHSLPESCPLPPPCLSYIYTSSCMCTLATASSYSWWSGDCRSCCSYDKFSWTPQTTVLVLSGAFDERKKQAALLERTADLRALVALPCKLGELGLSTNHCLNLLSLLLSFCHHYCHCTLPVNA